MGSVLYRIVIASSTNYRMSRVTVLALLVALAAVASAQYGIGNYYPFSGFNQAYYPNLQQGFGFYNHQPAAGYSGCQYWCRSPSYGYLSNNQYYCCTTPFQAGYGNQGGFGFGGGFNQYG